MAGFLSGLGQLSDAPNVGAGNGYAAMSTAATAAPTSLGQPQGGGQQQDPLAQLAAMRSGMVSQTPATVHPSLVGAGLQNNYQPQNSYDPMSGQPAAAAPQGGMTAGGLASWIAQAEKATGVNPAQWTAGLELIAQHESAGNPNAVNNWDSNAQAGHPSEGLMQTIGPTFNQYVPASMRGWGIMNPVANVAAAIEYILSRYGGIGNVPGVSAVAQGRPYVGY